MGTERCVENSLRCCSAHSLRAHSALYVRFPAFPSFYSPISLPWVDVAFLPFLAWFFPYR